MKNCIELHWDCIEKTTKRMQSNKVQKQAQENERCQWLGKDPMGLAASGSIVDHPVLKHGEDKTHRGYVRLRQQMLPK